ncbi:MAG TPA: IPT/TIG domain-containing protein [Thermoanaerobaculia bacterium]|nr:IPT/TIG domain-containing protein [Thermoanaerobaculia bacterium]
MKTLKFLTPVLFGAVLALAACTSSSKEPSQTPTTPVPPVPVATFNVTVTASPNTLTTGPGGSGTPSIITVTVRRSDTGQAPPDLTPVTLTTTLGEFGSVGSGSQTTNLQLVGGQATAALFPGNAAGTATIRAQVSQSTGVTSVSIGQPATFFVASVSPNVGNPQGGQTVTISGGGFAAPVRVTFGTAAATVRSVSPNQIVAVVPSAIAATGQQVGVGQSLPVAVGVTIHVNEAGTATDTLANGFTYALGGTDQPQVFSVSPASGPNDGGTTVTINGQGFVSPVQVFFQNTTVSLEASVQSVTANRIVVTTPAARGFGQGLANNPADVRVKNVNTGFQTISAGAFRFGSKVLITSFTPGQLQFNDTTSPITIFGQGFESPVSATIDTVAARVLSVSSTEVVVQSPGIRIASCQDVPGPVGVVNINTGDFDTTTGASFIYIVPKVAVGGVSPASGGEGGGDQITVFVTGIDPAILNATRVQFGDQTASNVRLVPNGIVVTSPRFTGTFQTQSCISGSQTGTQKIPTSIDIKVTNLESTCNDTSSKAFFYVPTDGSCQVTPPPPPTPPVASFTFFRVGGAASNQVQFHDTSSGSPTSWAWDFTNDGTIDSAAQNPLFTFPGPGTYSTRLRVTNAGGSNETVVQVTVPVP